MPLQLLPAEGLADMHRGAVIEKLAYDPYPSNRILFPGPFAPEALEKRAEELYDQSKEPNTLWYKVVDTDLEGDEQIIAISKWIVYDYKTVDAPKPKRPSRAFPEGSNPEACEMFFSGLAGLQKRMVGDRPHLYLSSLVTDPKHQRRGAGTMILQRGFEEAAKRDLPIYVIAAQEGHALYLKNGFRDLERMEADFSKWGLEELNLNWAMIRES